MSDDRQQLLNFEAPHNGTDTSIMAAEEIKPHLGRLQAEVYSYLLKQEAGGATCHEIAQMLGLSLQSATPRVYELRLKGKVRDSGHRRLTPTQRLAIVWVHDNVPAEVQGPYKSLTQQLRELRDSYNLLKQKFKIMEDHSKQKDKVIQYCRGYLQGPTTDKEFEKLDKVITGFLRGSGGPS